MLHARLLFSIAFNTDIYISHSPSNGDAYSFFTSSREITTRALTRASNSKERYNSLVISEIETQVAGRGGHC